MMFLWVQGTRRLTAAIRPPGYEYRHHHHQGHVCRAPTLEVRDHARVLLLLPLQAIEEVDEFHALGDLFEEVGAWLQFHAWLYGEGYEPKASAQGATGARPLLSERDARILGGQGLKLPNQGLVDVDYAQKLPPSERAWLARFLEHTVQNRWYYDGGDLVRPGSPLARSIYADYEARRRCYLVVPDREAPEHA